MAKPRPHLRNAPIVEAVIDFRVLQREGLAAEVFAHLGELIGSRYGKGSVMQSIEGRFGLDRGQLINQTTVKPAVGWQYRTDTYVTQFRVDGFTFSKLQPYTTWEEVFGEAFRLWNIYIMQAQPLEVSRIAVRYINRLGVPGPTDLRQYLEAPPLLPPQLPQKLRAFLSRLLVEDSSRRASAVLVQALEESLDPSLIPLLLDIDAYREVALPPKDTALPDLFQQLRELKNEIFYASVTEKTVEMYA